MKNHIAVMAWNQDGRISKFQDFADRADASAHVSAFAGQYPDAFVATRPASAGPLDWKVQGQALVADPRPAPPPPPERVEITAIKRIAAAAGVNLSDLDL